MGMKIIPVTDKKTRKEFLDVARRIYRGDDTWVCPLDKEINAVFEPSSNIFFRYGDAMRWILKDPQTWLAGCIAAFINRKANELVDQSVGGIGFFECVNDGKAVNLLFSTARNWLSRVPGGLIVTSILGEAGMAAAIGTSSACIVAVGKIAEPEFKKFGYDKAFAMGGMCCGGILGPLIPPSAGMIIYAVLSEVSLGHLFIAGIIPGILCAVMLASVAIIMCRRNPSLSISSTAGEECIS